MAYLSNEEVKEMRAKIKAAFPVKDGWKFSITRSNSTSINVHIMESKTINMDPENKGDFGVNHYWIKETYKDKPEMKNVFLKILECINGTKDNYDSNAGDIGADYAAWNYFINIEVGKWDKKYKYTGV